MKKIVGFLPLAFVVLVMTIACSNNAAEEKKDVTVKPSPVIVVKDPPAKSTTIVLDKKGVKVGTKKVDVNIKK